MSATPEQPSDGENTPPKGNVPVTEHHTPSFQLQSPPKRRKIMASASSEQPILTNSLASTPNLLQVDGARELTRSFGAEITAGVVPELEKTRIADKKKKANEKNSKKQKTA